MNSQTPNSPRDCWAEWILHRRFGGDKALHSEMMQNLYAVRDRVLDNARLSEGEVLLDVGTGDGLIAFGALERVGEGGRVIFSDISQDLLDHTRALAAEMGLLPRSDFVRAPADDLSLIPGESVDVVTTRSVLIYVKEKQRAFHEFYRVLKPGGRLSFFEPINSYGYPPRKDRFMGYDVTPVIDLSEKIRQIYRRVQPDRTDPMLDFDERDLVVFAEEAGFMEVHLHFEVSIVPVRKTTWESLLTTAPNPLAPTMQEAIEEALTPEEARRFVAHVRPLVEAGQGTRREAVAYLWALKEQAPQEGGER